MCTPAPSFEPGRTRANGPMMQPVPSSLCSSTEFGWMTLSAPMLTSRSTTFGPTRTRSPSVDLAFEQHVGVDEHVAPDADLAAHVDARRIRERGAREHELARAFGAMQRLELGELHLVVDAEHLRHGGRDERRDLHLVFHRHGDDVGEVVLTLRVGILELAEPLAQ